MGWLLMLPMLMLDGLLEVTTAWSEYVGAYFYTIDIIISIQI
jgi:hypothetical protein